MEPEEDRADPGPEADVSLGLVLLAVSPLPNLTMARFGDLGFGPTEGCNVPALTWKGDLGLERRVETTHSRRRRGRLRLVGVGPVRTRSSAPYGWTDSGGSTPKIVSL